MTRPTAQHTESASEDKFRLLFERTADALLLLDATSGVFVDCNAAAVAMLRCSNRQELLSLHPAEISPPHQPDGRPSREKADEMIAIAMRQGSHRFEWVHCGAHRADFPVGVLLTPIQTGDQQLIVARCRDLSERKKAEEAQQRLAAIIENTTDLVGQADSEGRLTYINAAGLRMLGAERMQQVMGRPIKDFHTPEAAARVLSEAIPAALRDGMWTGETELLALDGRVFPVSQLILVERAADGSVKHTTAVMRDLSERKRAEEALRRSETRFRFLFANSPLPMWVFSLETLRFLEVNDAAIALYGYSREEFLGMGIMDHVLPEDLPALHNALAKRQGAFNAAGEWRHRTKNGSVILVEIFVHKLDWEGQPAEHVVAIDVSERKRAEEALRLSEERSARHAREATQLTELVDILQSCQTVEEAYKITSNLLPTILSSQSGALYVTRPSRNIVEAVAAWGDALATEKIFAPDGCWALRRGKIHQANDSTSSLRCAHVSGSPPGGYLCVPLVAQGETLGVLYVECRSPLPIPSLRSQEDQMETLSRQATAVGERVSLALANIRLREALRAQSIRDSLTGLFNRRYLEETLDRELSRAVRAEQPLSLLMLDIDHFKRFNDTFGHQAGDTLLRALGDFLGQRTRGQDVACRFGGEEFVLILAGASVDAACKRAELLRQEFNQLTVQHAGQVLGRTTFSIGISAFPSHGTTAEELLRAADQALYHAKQEGRDKVVVA